MQVRIASVGLIGLLATACGGGGTPTVETASDCRELADAMLAAMQDALDDAAGLTLEDVAGATEDPAFARELARLGTAAEQRAEAMGCDVEGDVMARLDELEAEPGSLGDIALEGLRAPPPTGQRTVESDLRNAAIDFELFYTEENRYPASLDELEDLDTSEGVTIELVSVTAQTYCLRGEHEDGSVGYYDSDGGGITDVPCT